MSRHLDPPRDLGGIIRAAGDAEQQQVGGATRAGLVDPAAEPRRIETVRKRAHRGVGAPRDGVVGDLRHEGIGILEAERGERQQRFGARRVDGVGTGARKRAQPRRIGRVDRPEAGPLPAEGLAHEEERLSVRQRRGVRAERRLGDRVAHRDIALDHRNHAEPGAVGHGERGPVGGLEPIGGGHRDGRKADRAGRRRRGAGEGQRTERADEPRRLLQDRHHCCCVSPVGTSAPVTSVPRNTGVGITS